MDLESLCPVKGAGTKGRGGKRGRGRERNSPLLPLGCLSPVQISHHIYTHTRARASSVLLLLFLLLKKKKKLETKPCWEFRRRVRGCDGKPPQEKRIRKRKGTNELAVVDSWVRLLRFSGPFIHPFIHPHVRIRCCGGDGVLCPVSYITESEGENFGRGENVFSGHASRFTLHASRFACSGGYYLSKSRGWMICL